MSANQIWPRSLRTTGRPTVALATAPAGESVVPGLKYAIYFAARGLRMS